MKRLEFTFNTCLQSDSTCVTMCNFTKHSFPLI